MHGELKLSEKLMHGKKNWFHGNSDVTHFTRPSYRKEGFTLKFNMFIWNKRNVGYKFKQLRNKINLELLAQISFNLELT